MTKRGVITPVVDADARSAYPAAFSLLGCWDVLRSEGVVGRDACPDLRALGEQVATGDLAPLFDPATYRQFGLCLCEVLLDGHDAPVEWVDGAGRSRLAVTSVRSPVSLPYTCPDYLLSALRTRRAPGLVRAIRLEPHGSRQGRPLPLRDGLIVGAGEDPVAVGVRLRSRLRDAASSSPTDLRPVVQLRVFGNSLAWGNFSRLDQRRVRADGGRRSELVEESAEWTWPPIASTVPAVVRLWLAVVERLWTDPGGVIVTGDTDGLAVLATPRGGPVELGNGRVEHALSWAEVDAVLTRFDALDPFGDGRPFWKRERGTEDRPLHVLSLAPKRYVKAKPGPSGFEVVGGTEHALGGGVVDPPALAGRDADRRHLWTIPVADYALARALADSAGLARPGFCPPWDAPGETPFPVLRRFSAASPKTLDQLPEALGAHPFAPLVEGQPDRFLARHADVPVALDPGTDLSDWADLPFHDDYGPIQCITIGIAGPDAMPLQTLRDFARDWAMPRSAEDPSLIEVHPNMIRRVGRGGALIDAQLAEADADPDDFTVVYDEGDPGAYVAAEARQHGPCAFARRTGLAPKAAERAARGKPISPANAAKALAGLGRNPVTRQCALDGCEHPVLRPNATYCSKAHRDRAWRQRKRGEVVSSRPEPACPHCDAVVVATSDGVCPVCSYSFTRPTQPLQERNAQQ
jgi:hypothetical protein